MSWTHVIREVYCSKDWGIKGKAPKFPKHCKKKLTSPHCFDIEDNESNKHCKYVSWCDVSNEFRFTNNGSLIKKSEKDCKKFRFHSH